MADDTIPAPAPPTFNIMFDGLTSKPVLEMALNMEVFRGEVADLLERE